MKTKKIIHALGLCSIFLTFGVVAKVAYAQSSNDDGYSYVKTADGQIVRSGYNLCWQDPYHGNEAYCDKKEMVAQNEVVVAPPPPPSPVHEREHYDATVLFNFDSSYLTDESRDILDNLIAKTKEEKVNGDTVYIDVIGHTDRYGTEHYNQKLSERRADTVAHYLEEHGVYTTDGNVYARGVGKANPVVECNEGSFAANVKCLHPNRRVHAIIHINEDKPHYGDEY